MRVKDLSKEEKGIVEGMTKDQFLDMLKIVKASNIHERLKDFKDNVFIDTKEWPNSIPGDSNQTSHEVYAHHLKQLEAFNIEKQEAMIIYGFTFFDVGDDIADDIILEHYTKAKVLHYKKIDWLKKKMSEESEQPDTGKKEKPELQLQLQQIALLYIYFNETITRENAKKIAKKYKHNSGEKLLRHYNNNFKTIDRTGDPGRKIQLQNKIKRIESIIHLLPTDRQGRPNKEIDTLRTHLENNY